MEYFLSRTEALIGKEAIQKLQQATVCVFGLGGVGSYVVEALARSGIGSLVVVDSDVISLTNINRQLLADFTTIGRPKVEVCKERLLHINPNLQIRTYQEFYDESKSELISSDFSYIVDSIDTVSSKLSIIEEAQKKHIPLISCMGTGNKLDSSKFEITDISKTSVCPLAKVIRKECKRRNLSPVTVLYSREEPVSTFAEESCKKVPASISFVPSVAGLMLAGEVIRNLIS